MNIHINQKPDYIAIIETELNNIAWHLQVVSESNQAPVEAVIKMHLQAAHHALNLHDGN